MNGIRMVFRRKRQALIMGLPLAAVLVASALPLRQVFQQALIGVALIWFQVSLMLGTFSADSGF